jgi:hypothetical protein
VVVASDGARLSAERISRLDAYLDEFASRRADLRGGAQATKIIDDLTIITASLR